MYSHLDLINAIDHEVNVIKHLASKVEAQHHGHKFTDKQRTIRELLAYLAYQHRQTQLIFTGDMGLFADMQVLTDSFDPAQFTSILDAEWSKAKALIQAATPEQLAEEVTIFGRFTKTRIKFLIEWVFGQVTAYKMQLFLQLKHAGRHELATPNLWMGMDPEPKA